MENRAINELTDVYNYLSSDDELYHHGVLGMKWGIRRYQPYSLIPRGSGKRGKEIGIAKKSKSTKTTASSSKRGKKKSRKQTQEEVKAKRIQDLQTARQRAEQKQKLLKSGDAKQIYENRESFTTKQMQEAIDRINTERALRSLVAEQNPSKTQQIKKKLNKIVNSDNIQKTADAIEKGINLYNQAARIANVVRDDEHQLKYVGKAENKKPDERGISKAAQAIINSGDPVKILENQDKFTNAEVKAAKDRLADLASIRSQQKGIVKFDTEMAKAVEENRKESRRIAKEEADYQKGDKKARQERVESNIADIKRVKEEYGPGGDKYIELTPSPQKPVKTKTVSSKQLLETDASRFTPSSKSSKAFDDYFDSEVAKVNPYGKAGTTKIGDARSKTPSKTSSDSDFGKITTNPDYDKYFEGEVAKEKKKKNVTHSDISINELYHQGVYNYIGSDDELYHHGVLGMKWGIRRYQSYDTVPRKSGKGGKEIGTAAEVFNSLSTKEKANISTSSSFSNSPTLVRRATLKDSNGHAQAYAEIERDPDDSTVGYISVAVHKNDRGQGLSERVCRDVLDDLKDTGLKEVYWETTKDNPASSATAKKLGFEKAKDFESNDDNYVLKVDSSDNSKSSIKNTKEQNISFGNNKECLVTIDDGGSPSSVERIVNDKKFESIMRKSAADGLYEYRLNESQNESKSEYTKNLKCVQITAFEPRPGDNGDTVDLAVWYNNPKDFGDWYMEINSAKRKISYAGGYT